jgi:hypothetical protein
MMRLDEILPAVYISRITETFGDDIRLGQLHRFVVHRATAATEQDMAPVIAKHCADCVVTKTRRHEPAQKMSLTRVEID